MQRLPRIIENYVIVSNEGKWDWQFRIANPIQNSLFEIVDLKPLKTI